MNAFKKKVVASAVCAAVAGVAHAVNVDPNGQGQVLIYPYYTVQGGFNTYVSVVNTTSSVKVVKVRFREGKASKEVLDFNLYLSPYDVWTGAVVPVDATDTSAAKIITADTSCTNPAIPSGGEPFRNFLYRKDGAGDATLARTREGYLEMIEMGVLDPETSPGSNAVHTAAGVPKNCAALRGTTVSSVATAITEPTGGLNGTGTLINVTNGQDAGYNAVALANFVRGDDIYAEIGNDNPNLNSGRDTNDEGTSFALVDGTAYRANFGSVLTVGSKASVNAVSSTLMHTAVINEYVLDTTTNSNTDWVLTFPTKQFYVDDADAQAPFVNKLTATGSCQPIKVVFYDREEQEDEPSDVDFSPLPPSGDGKSVCWESTVVSIRNGAAHMPAAGVSGVLNSKNVTSIEVVPTFQNGWAAITFDSTAAKMTGLVPSGGLESIDLNSSGSLLSGAGTFTGLPVVGFMVRTFNNGTLGSFQANYGSAFNHKYRQKVNASVF